MWFLFEIAEGHCYQGHSERAVTRDEPSGSEPARDRWQADDCRRLGIPALNSHLGWRRRQILRQQTARIPAYQPDKRLVPRYTPTILPPVTVLVQWSSSYWLVSNCLKFWWKPLTHYRPAMPFGNRKKNILEDVFSSALSQFKKYHPSGNLKFNYLGIFQSLKLRISTEKIL